MIKDLIGKSTVKRRKAAIKLRGDNLNDNTCAALLEALRIEDSKDNWQTEVEVIKTIGLGGCINALDFFVKKNVDDFDSFSLTAMAYSTALVRLKRKNLEDCDQVLSLIKTDSYSLVEGALEALGYDRMVPSFEHQKEILMLCKSFGLDRPKGYTDPRYGLVAACAKWEKEIVHNFLKDCMLSQDEPLKYVAKNSLEGKYVKLR